MKIVYLIGEPGIGKTTVMRAVASRFGDPVQIERPVPHLVWDGGTIELGRRREGFGGTDALGMAVQPVAIRWLRSKPAELVLGEGDRLGNASFFAEVARFADLRVIMLSAPPEVALRRRRERGSTQSEAWIAGRITKVNNLRAWASRIIDARLPVGSIASAVAQEVFH